MSEIKDLQKKLGKHFDVTTGITYDDSMTLIPTGAHAIDLV